MHAFNKYGQMSAAAAPAAAGAAFVSLAQMATLSQANATLYNFAAAAKRKAQVEIDLITQFAADKNATLPLEPWDVKYWRERYKLDTFKVDQAALREYLMVDNVLNGMFQVRLLQCLLVCYIWCLNFPACVFADVRCCSLLGRMPVAC